MVKLNEKAWNPHKNTCYGLGLAVQMCSRIWNIQTFQEKHEILKKKLNCERRAEIRFYAGMIFSPSNRSLGFSLRIKRIILLSYDYKNTTSEMKLCDLCICFHISDFKLIFQNLNILKGIFVLLLKYNPQWSTAIHSCLME